MTGRSTKANSTASNPKSKKKKSKKKPAAPEVETNGEPSNGIKNAPDTEAEEAEDVEPETPTVATATEDEEEQLEAAEAPISSVKTNGIGPDHSTDTSERLEALARDRDALRVEVSELRKSLEAIQSKHEEEVNGLQEQLEESNFGKEQAEAQYNDLLGRVNTLKAQLGERLKADAEEISQARSQIEELEEQNRSIRDTNESLQADLSKLTTEHEQQAQEVASLRSRANLSQQNWVKERDELISREAFAREEFETAKQAMQDWEVLALEERSLRENLTERVAELEEQLNNQREAYERAAAERDTQSQTVDGLQRALKDIQDARKKELRELVENSQAQLEDLREQLQTAEETSTAAKAKLEMTQKELERAKPFEKEVKEKNLLIGKLRHEGVILNDHLTKALRFLKQRKPEDMVDRQLVTNHFLHFITLDRSDPKKFQILQLIAALLSWTDEEKEQAGLARPGASNTILRVPNSSFRRTPSTPSLSTQLDTTTSKESLAELWSDFLEREAKEGMSPSASRRPSTASTLERRDSERQA